jgi:serine/threonine protein kinase
MGQQLSFAHDEQLGRSINSRNFKSNTKGIEHEGILRFRSIPFCGSTQIAKSPALFLENADYSLQEILESRLNTTRLLTEDDLLKLLEYVLYTLAYLQSLGVLYKDLVPSNIYYLID